MTEAGVRYAAIVLSISVHAVVFWWYDENLWEKNNSADFPTIVARLSLAQPPTASAAPVPTAPEPIQKAPQEHKPVAEPKAETQLAKPQKILQTVTAKVGSLQPVAEVQHSQKPISPVDVEKDQREEVVETATRAEPPPINTESTESQPSSQPMQQAVAAKNIPADEEQAARELQRYLAALRASIVANKHYPAIARRRGMEGKVKVSFLLLANGDIRELRVSGGPKPLRLAAKRAVDKALLFPSPPAHATTPLPVQYAMSFNLQ